MTNDVARTLGLVLAGGQARRMGGGDKALLRIGGETVLSRTLRRVTPHCRAVALNANGDPSRFAAFGLPVIADSVADFAGPLAGVLAGMDWAAAADPDAEWLATVPGDCPFLPHDLIPRLHHARNESGRPIACAKSGEWRHPVAAIWPVGLREDLRHALTAENLRKIEIFTERYGVALAEWPDRPIDYFFNVNRPDDLAEAERIAAENPQA
jgi:molybdopterin-guanine dinucleotide biosynthesis protein A